MLVLSRRAGERICITLPDGRDVVVEVVRVERDHVRLGFKADRGVTIDRGELRDRKSLEGDGGRAPE